MSREIKLKDGVIREEPYHLIISLYLDGCTVNLGLSYYALFAVPRDKVNDYILWKIEELQSGHMSC